MTFDLILDTRVVHDPGGIKGVAEEIAPLIFVPAELSAQIRVKAVELLFLEGRWLSQPCKCVCALTVQIGPMACAMVPRSAILVIIDGFCNSSDAAQGNGLSDDPTVLKDQQLAHVLSEVTTHIPEPTRPFSADRSSVSRSEGWCPNRS